MARKKAAASRVLAIAAPWAMAAIFAQTMRGSTSAEWAKVANPQSVPAITFSRPTMRA